MKKSILLFALSSLFLTACQEQNSEQVAQKAGALINEGDRIELIVK